ncbi:recombinase family protein [Streptomyces sp. NPDC040724]|uniref:recombinase family protein n=1 Tax=Streptomyces sp. NPDC040724 TaxID=3155612 RepID=UPI0033D069A1
MIGPGQDRAGQVRLLKEADCVHIYVEKVDIRDKIRPECNAALADLRPADTLTVTVLDRLGRNIVELITSAQDLAERDHRLEIFCGRPPCPASTTRRARARSCRHLRPAGDFIDIGSYGRHIYGVTARAWWRMWSRAESSCRWSSWQFLHHPHRGGEVGFCRSG